MDPGRDRSADWRDLDALAASSKPFIPIPVFAGLPGLPISPWTRQVIQEALAKQPCFGRPTQALPVGQGLGPWLMDRETGQALAAALQRVKTASDPANELARNAPPRVLAVLHDDNALIVFRGTSTLFDVWRDLCCWPPALAWPLRHRGFQRTWQEVKPQVDAWLAGVAVKLGRPPNVYLGGHSLGGAVATLAALDLSGTHKVARVVTLGSPRVGGRSLRSLYASREAAPASDGTVRCLPAETTRWVHGTDLFATLIPPPGPTVHMSGPTILRASDRLDIEEYFPSTLMDATPLVNLVSRLGTTPGAQKAPSTWTHDARRAASQIAFWLAMKLPWDWRIRLFVPLIPLVAEQLTRSSLQHKCSRYLGFMPPTALYRAMYPAVPQQPEAQPHVLKVL